MSANGALFVRGCRLERWSGRSPPAPVDAKVTTRPTRATGTTPLTRIGPGMLALLLDRDGFRQIPWLVDIQASEPRDAIREQLQRHDGEHRLQEGRSPRDVDDVVGVMLDVLVAVRRNRDYMCTPRTHFLDVGDHLV